MWVGANADINDLKESARHREEFLAMLAHELRNPLAPIRNGLQILRHVGGDAATPAIDMMQRQVAQMVRLVDDLLDVSRISHGKISLRRARIEIASVVNLAVDAVRAQCERAEQALVVTLPGDPVYVDADPARLAQIVGNLLSNAAKFTERGGRIALTVERDGAHAVIRVHDNGIGISAAELPRIFTIFTQVDTSRERAQGGLGLGLTLVKTLVEMHEGSVEAHSRGLGEGAEFVVRLPILTERLVSPAEPAVSTPAVSLEHRILVVDDNHDSADSLAMWLKLGGHEVHTAHDGMAAVELAATLEPDVIVLDIGLPLLNGYEAARRIRQLPASHETVLVALTGWGQEEDKRRSRDAGFDFHIVKPIEPAALDKILSSLSPRRRAAPLGEPG